MFGIGIDVSKATLDVVVHGEQFRQFSNDKRGFVRLIRWLKTWPIKQVVLEASGGYERAALDVLHAAGLPMVRINPARARRFAQGTGRAAKTDRLDATVLAQMAHLLPLTRYVPPAPWQQRLAEFAQCRRHLVQMRVSEMQRLRRLVDPDLIAMKQRHIAQLSDDLKQLDKAIAEQLEGQPGWKNIGTLKGVGPILIRHTGLRVARTGQLGKQSHSIAGGVGPDEPRKWHLAGPTADQWWARSSTRSPLHGGPDGHPVRARTARVLRWPEGQGQSEQGGARGGHAQNAGDPQRP